MSECTSTNNSQRLATDLQQARKELQVQQRHIEQLLFRVESLDAELDRVRSSATRERDSRLQAEVALDSTRERLQLAVDVAGLALWDWYLPAEEVFMSARWGAMVGQGALDGYWSPSKLRELVHQDDLPRVKAALGALKSGAEERATVQFRVQALTGWIWVESHGMVAECSAAGVPQRLMGTHADISDRKTIEVEMQRARELAERASKAKSDFLANISHEVRTPLNAVMGLTQLLLDSPLTSEQRNWLILMDDAAQALLALLNDVLDLARIESGKFAIEHIAFNLSDLLDEVAQLYAVQAQAKDIRLSVKRDQDLPDVVVGDPVRVRQVLLNLLSNAVKFTPEHGEVELSALAQSSGTSAKALTLQVRDTGVGIPADKQALIFESFTQADDSIVRRFGGSGLGLTICDKLVRKMGGAMKLSSTPGKGSSFSFSLPKSIPETCSGATTPQTPSVLTTDARTPTRDRRFRGLRVLVAEDNPVNELLLRKHLEHHGCSVIWAKDGQQAIASWRSDRPDMILMDVHMPVTDGLQAARFIRRAEREGEGTQHTPIIAITANAMQGNEQACRSAGMDAYLTKPFRLALLDREMSKLLVRSKGSPPDPTRGVNSVAAGAPAWVPSPQLLESLKSDTEGREPRLKRFLVDLPAALEDLERVLEHRNGQMALSIVQSLNEIFAQLKADRSLRLAKGLEMAARAEEWALFGKVLPLLRDEVNRLAQVISEQFTPR